MGCEGAELDPPVVEVGRIRSAQGRCPQEAADVVAHVGLADGGLVRGERHLLGEGVPGTPGVAGEGDGRGVVGPRTGRVDLHRVVVGGTDPGQDETPLALVHHLLGVEMVDPRVGGEPGHGDVDSSQHQSNQKKSTPCF
jgi:hypothetical protein